MLKSNIIIAFERMSEVFKTLLWTKAKAHGISPIQIQILLFISDHAEDLCNVSHLAIEFNVTKATISDAVRVLVNKELLEKDYSPTDNRRYNLLITKTGKSIVADLSDYAMPVLDVIETFGDKELTSMFDTMSKLIYQLNQKDVIQVQRICYKCQHYSGDRKSKHFCNLLDTRLKAKDIRLDCDDFVSM